MEVTRLLAFQYHPLPIFRGQSISGGPVYRQGGFAILVPRRGGLLGLAVHADCR